MSTYAIQTRIACDHSFILEGQVTSATSTSLTDSSKNWPPNIWRGRKLSIISGLGAGQVVECISNTFTTVYFNMILAQVADTTSVYRGFVFSTSSYCTKCLGSNYYNDINFVGGKTKLVTGIQKLAQDIETVVVYPRGASIFTSNFGSALSLLISADILNDDELLPYAERNLQDAISFLINAQSDALNILDFDNSELFGQLLSSLVTRGSVDPTILECTVVATSSSNQQAQVSGPLLIR